MENGEENSYENIIKINEWLSTNGYCDIGDDIIESGGNKSLEQPVYVAAFNYFDLKKFSEFIKTLKWEYPEDVQIFYCCQDDSKFTLYEPFN